MDTKTLDALQGSKLHWCNIRDGLEEEHGIRNCPLCKLFYGKYCVGCPVFEKTGEVGCKNTPYIAWHEHHQLNHDYPKRVHADCPECKQLAQAELDFLESLLPNMEKAVRNLQKQYNDLWKMIDEVEQANIKLDFEIGHRLTEFQESIEVLANDGSRMNQAIVDMIDGVKQRLAALEAKATPAPEPSGFKVEEKYNSKGENYNNYFLDHNNQPIAILSKIVCRQLNANEARKEVAGQLELLQYHNLGWPNDFYTIVDKIKIIVKHFKAIDDYEAGR